jgi:hypothetical protein
MIFPKGLAGMRFFSTNGIRTAGRVCGWAALITMFFILLTGYGITQFRIVDPLTIGLLNKAVSQRWHQVFGIPLIFLLILHVGIALWWRLSGAGRKE